MNKFAAISLSIALTAVAAMPALASHKGGSEHVHGYTTHSGKHVSGYTRHKSSHHSNAKHH